MDPFLTLNGNPVDILVGLPDLEPHEVGERHRAFDGTARSSVRARKRDWRGLMTDWLLLADATVLENLLNSAPPLTADGRLLEGIATSVHTIWKGRRGYRHLTRGLCTMVEFDMLEV